MKITLVSHLVAYNLYTLMLAAEPNMGGRSVRGLQVQLPSSAIEAANSGAWAKLGKPNAAATAVDPILVLEESDNENYPQNGISNTISLVDISAIASADNAVLYVNPSYA